MNRIILSLPKPILKKYVLKHFSDLSVDDFFQVIKRVEIPAHYFGKNGVLNKNSNVLSYMLGIHKNVFEYFEPEAFSEECINQISDLGSEIYPHHIDKYPMLLQNRTICEAVVQSFPDVVKKLDASQITERVMLY